MTFFINNIYAESLLTIEIHNVVVNGGMIFLGIYFNELSFRNKNPDITLQINPINNKIVKEIALPEGEYVIGIHQDTNGNGEMDYGLFGIPKETFGFSNMKGRIPRNFSEMKFGVKDSNNGIIISFVKY
jgi:uncharacterized protein (DUF2141 family)